MNILITGSRGFVGRNLTAALQCIRDGKDKTTGLDPDITIFEYDINTDPKLLEEYCARADFVFNLAGVNRPDDPAEFMAGNCGFAQRLLDSLKAAGNTCPVMLSSSVKAVEDNPYGKSKRAAEELFFAYAAETAARVLVYRLPNLFGKWCRPNYNSVTATFCHNIAHGQPITINNPLTELTLAYIDDVVAEFIRALRGMPDMREDGFCHIGTTYTVTLGQLAGLIKSFCDCRTSRTVPDTSDEFTAKLYATYLSYLPADGFSYPLELHSDARGSFAEFLRTPERGQISVNVTRPGAVRGNHWHNTKNEKFLVISGSGVIRFRRVGDGEVFEYAVDGATPRVVEIPPGYTHSIVNTGDADLVTLIWASECFDPSKPDTFAEEV